MMSLLRKLQEETWFPGFLSPLVIYRVPKQALPTLGEMEVLPFLYDTGTEFSREIVLFAGLFTSQQQHVLHEYGVKPTTVTMLGDDYDEVLYGEPLKSFEWAVHQARDLFGHEQYHETVLLFDAPEADVRQAFEASCDRVLPGFSTIEIYWQEQSKDLLLLGEGEIRLLQHRFVSYLGTDPSIQRAKEIVAAHPDRLRIGGGVESVTLRDFVHAYREHLSVQPQLRTLKKLKEFLAN